jgi:hypothetical protein
MKRIYRWRDAITGRFVRMAYGLMHPRTTIRTMIERRRYRRRQ